MSATVALTGFVALVARCSCKFLCFLIQELIQRFLNAFPYQILQFSIDSFLI